MPTTRAQEAAKHSSSPTAAGKHKPPSSRAKKPASALAKKPPSPKKSALVKKEEEPAPTAGQKRQSHDAKENHNDPSPPAKKVKIEDPKETETKAQSSDGAPDSGYQAGTIERGHVYFFYRPKVELEEAHSLDDVQRFYMLLVPRPAQFAAPGENPASAAQTTGDPEQEQESEMNLIPEGADAVPAAEPTGTSRKPFRLLHIGKKALPDPEAGGGGRGGGRKQVFWATVGTVGEDLKKLEQGLGAKTYETKTRGTRHQGPARLAARGAYAIVNTEAKTPSQRETHLGYYLSHPTAEHMGEVQEELGIHQASSFVLQVKNPLAPPTGPGQVGLVKGRRADYPEDIMQGVFGKGGKRGRESYGLRFAACERKELLDYEGAELLFIAARSGENGLEQSLGEGRGQALEQAERDESKESMQQVMKELAMDEEKIPAEPLEGVWA